MELIETINNYIDEYRKEIKDLEEKQKKDPSRYDSYEILKSHYSGMIYATNRLLKEKIV